MQACGADLTVTPEDVEAEDVDALKRQVAKQVTQVCCTVHGGCPACSMRDWLDAPLISMQSNFVDHFKGPAGRKFRANYQHFWASALQRLGELEALHGPTLEGLQNLLTSLVW